MATGKWIRLAKSPEEAKKFLTAVRTHAEEMQKLLDATIAKLVRSESRERLQRAKKVADDYVAGAGDIAVAETAEQKERIARERTDFCSTRRRGFVCQQF